MKHLRLLLVFLLLSIGWASTGVWAKVYNSGTIAITDLHVGDTLMTGVSVTQGDMQRFSLDGNTFFANDNTQISPYGSLLSTGPWTLTINKFNGKLGVICFPSNEPGVSDIYYYPSNGNGERGGNAWLVTQIYPEGNSFYQVQLAGIEVDGAPGFSQMVYEYDDNTLSAKVVQNPDKYKGKITIPPSVYYHGHSYTVVEIADEAFRNCTELTSVTIPESVYEIGYPLFFGCEDLNSIVVAEGNPNYDSRNNCNAIIKKTGDRGPILVAGCKNTVIPSSVREIYYRALAYKSLTSITIPEGVEWLQPAVFYGSGLTSINIPASMIAMFDNPFQACEDLTTITVAPDNNRYDSRENCNAIIETSTNTLVASCPTTVIPSSVKVIGSYAFASRNDLTTFSIPSGVTEIGRSAFQYCYNLQSIDLPNSLQIIAPYAFWYCQSLNHVVLGTGIIRVADDAFACCSELDDITVKSSTFLWVPESTLSGIKSTATIKVPEALVSEYQANSPWNLYNIVADGSGSGGSSSASTYIFVGTTAHGSTTTPHKYADLHAGDGKKWWAVLFNATKAMPIYMTNLSGEDCVVFDDDGNVLDALVENDDFPINGKIKKVKVKAAGNLANLSCEIQVQEPSSGSRGTLLTNGTLEWVTKEQQYLQAQAGDFQEYTFTFAGNEEYQNAKVRICLEGPSTPGFLQSITIEQDGEEGGGSTETTLSGTTGELTWEATRLEDIFVPGNNGEIVQKPTYRITLSGTGSTADYQQVLNEQTGQYLSNAPWISFDGFVTEVVVNEGVARIGDYAFADCTYLQNLTLPSSIREIGYAAFQSADIYELTLPEGLMKIYGYAFAFSSRFKNINIPASVTFVSGQAFIGNRLESITVAPGNSKYYGIEGSAVLIDKATNELVLGSPLSVIPDVVTSIGSYAFFNANNLTSMQIPDNVTSIGASAFSWNYGLTAMELPNSITSLGDRVFYGCQNMTTFTMGNGLLVIGRSMFENCSKLADVYCYTNPTPLTWDDAENAKMFMANKATKFHVPGDYLQAWLDKYGNMNVTFVGDLPNAAPEPQKAEPELAFSEMTVETFYGAQPTLPTLTNNNNLEVVWTSDNEQVATVDQTGKVTITGVGTTTIKAVFAGNDNFLAGGAFYALNVGKGVAELIFPVETFTQELGATDVQWPVATSLPEGLTVTYYSDNEQVATINEQTAAVTMLTAGTVAIKAFFAGSELYAPADTTYLLTITEPIVPEPQPVDAELAFSAASVETTLGEQPTFPVLTNKYQVEVVWTSDNEQVATVDAEGNITIVGVGMTNIKVAFIGNDQYLAGNASYVLKVNQPVVPEPEKVDVELAFVKPMIETVYGKLPITPTLKNRWRVETTWSSTNTQVATVDQEGKLSVKGIGETTIKAAFAGDDVYNAGEATYTLKVNKGEAALIFPNSLFTCVMGSTVTAWPSVESLPEGLSVSYSCDNTSVATVDAATGAVTMLGTGNAIIKAVFAGNDFYNAAEAAYTLSVAKPSAKQPQLNFGNVLTMSVAKGQEFTQPAIANPEALPLVWTTDDASVATVDEMGNLTIKDLGTTTVTATWAGNDEWKAASASYQLEVRIVESIVEETAVTFGTDGSGITEETNLENTTVGGMLFTLDSSQGDGYDKEDASISIQSTLTGDQIDAIISTTEPGTPEFAAAFAGMSFLLNAGKGSVDVDFFTMGDHQLSVKLGGKAAATFTKNARGTITIDYDVEEDTWVYVYASLKPATSASRTSYFRNPAHSNLDTSELSRLKIYGFNIKPTEIIATGISEVGRNSYLAPRTSHHRMYNLQGVRVNAPTQRGLYIMNGRKVVVR